MLLNKGYSTWYAGRLTEAIELFDESIAIAKTVEEGEHALAQSLLNKGEVLRHLGRLQESLACDEEAVTILRQLIEAGRHLTFELASAIMSKGSTLLSLGGNVEEAILCHRESVHLFEKVLSECRPEVSSRIATSYMNLGITLSAADNHIEALTYLGKANDTFKYLIENDGRTDLQAEYCKALTNRSSVFMALGKFQDALVDIEEGIRLSDTREIASRVEHPAEVRAGLLVNKASVQYELEDYSGALYLANKSIEIFEQLINEGRGELYFLPASATYIKANALVHLDMKSDALNCFEDSIRMLRDYSSYEKEEVLITTIEVLKSKARLLDYMEQSSATLSCFEEAIELLQTHINKGRVKLLPELIKVSSYKIISLFDLDKWQEAAHEVKRLWVFAAPIRGADKQYQELNRAWEKLADSYNDLTEDHKQQLYYHLGDDSQDIIGFLDKEQTNSD